MIVFRVKSVFHRDEAECGYSEPTTDERISGARLHLATIKATNPLSAMNEC